MTATSTACVWRRSRPSPTCVPHWSAYPGGAKPRADAAFCDGSQPLHLAHLHRLAARVRQAGLRVLRRHAHQSQRHLVAQQAGPFLDYLARCQFLLRQGRFVADVCCYTGDKPYLHWGRAGNGAKPRSLAARATPMTWSTPRCCWPRRGQGRRRRPARRHALPPAGRRPG